MNVNLPIAGGLSGLSCGVDQGIARALETDSTARISDTTSAAPVLRRAMSPLTCQLANRLQRLGFSVVRWPALCRKRRNGGRLELPDCVRNDGSRTSADPALSSLQVLSLESGMCIGFFGEHDPLSQTPARRVQKGSAALHADVTGRLRQRSSIPRVSTGAGWLACCWPGPPC